MGEPELSSGYNIMPKHILKPIMDTQGADGVVEMWGIDAEPKDLVGYGPWVIDSYEMGTNIVFKRNDRYFFKDEWNNRLPYLDKIITSKNFTVVKYQIKIVDNLSVDPQTGKFKLITTKNG